ncbi:transposase InsO family protein [Bradyrhizobium sp. i1.3.6]
MIDAYARKIVGWRASRTAHAGFVLDPLEQDCLIDGRSIVAGPCTTATGAAKADSNGRRNTNCFHS